ncbi:MAG TPA: LysM peptidoglycan-binding domain-containing protein [Isosphaeraceae bacterium]|jgi:nucleoid-associated protein YgaU|nr:LysM peptidoglycan-binding domain-containing protein [Isosphaeraceae bacterium]
MSEPILNPVAVDDSIPGPVASPPAEPPPEPAPAAGPARRPAFGREKRIALAVALSATTLVGVFVANRLRGGATKTKTDATAQAKPENAPRSPAVAQIPPRTPSATPPRSVAEAPPVPAPVVKPRSEKAKDEVKVVDHPPAPADHDSTKPHGDDPTPEPAVTPPAANPVPAIVETTKEESRAVEVTSLDTKREDKTAPETSKLDPTIADPAPESVVESKPEPKPQDVAATPVAEPKVDEPLAPLPTPDPVVVPPAVARTPKEDPVPNPTVAQAPAPSAMPPQTAPTPRELPAPAAIEPATVAIEPAGGWVTLPNRRSSARQEPRVEPATTPVPSRLEGPGAVDDGGPIRHKVRRGENFWTLAKTYYGSGRFYKALWAANRDQVATPEALEVGMTIQVPMPEALDPALIEPASRAAGRSKPAGRARSADDEPPPVVAVRPTPTAILEDERPAPKSWSRLDHPTHRVRAGENLRTIARDYLGDPLREQDLVDLNPDLLTDPPRAPVGALLRLPDDAHASRRRGKGTSAD